VSTTFQADVAPAERTLPRLLAMQAARYPDRTLFSCGDAAWTFTETLDVAARAAGALHTAGVRPGERVAILCSNRHEVMRVFLGCAWLGAIAVPINTAAKGPQLRYALENSAARLLVIEDTLAAVLEHCPLDGLPLDRIWCVGDVPAPQASGRALEAFPGDAAPIPPSDVKPSETLAILYTSGTTGPSKGVCCPHAQFYWWGVHTARFLDVREGDVLCTTLPLFHTNALNTFFQSLANGATQAVEPRFSASGFWPAMVRSGASVTYLLGAMVPILLAQPPSEHERAHSVRVALAPGVPAGLRPEFKDRTGVDLIDGYGSTETNFVIGATVAEQRPGKVGRLAPGFQARVVDDEDNPLAPGVAGELLLRADEPFAFATGYFAMPDKTVETWRNLWFHTGDRVVMDGEGYFTFVDRLKDAIRRRGENISSFEVEQVLAGHAAVAAVAVFPVASDLAEDEVMAAIVAKPGTTIDPVELLRYCEPRLPYFALPRYLDFVDVLPTTENGKVRKTALRTRGVTPATWDREKAGYKMSRRATGSRP
jgi:crotonobetaine/carnitine-CoA ligase